MNKRYSRLFLVCFYVDRCGHCKQLAPDWERLADDWKDSSTGLIAQVDCTDPAAESLCDEYGVDGYPTLIYGDAYSPELYEGDRDYESLAAFAQEHLTNIPCSLRNLAACPPEIQTVIQQLRDTSRQDLLIMEQAIDAELDQAEDAYETAMEQLNDQYTTLVDNYNAQLKHIRDEKHYKWLQMVLAESDPPLEDLMMDMDDHDLDEDDDDDDDTNPSTDEL